MFCRNDKSCIFIEKEPDKSRHFRVKRDQKRGGQGPAVFLTVLAGLIFFAFDQPLDIALVAPCRKCSQEEACQIIWAGHPKERHEESGSKECCYGSHTDIPCCLEERIPYNSSYESGKRVEEIKKSKYTECRGHTFAASPPKPDRIVVAKDRKNTRQRQYNAALSKERCEEHSYAAFKHVKDSNSDRPFFPEHPSCVCRADIA